MIRMAQTLDTAPPSIWHSQRLQMYQTLLLLSLPLWQQLRAIGDSQQALHMQQYQVTLLLLLLLLLLL